MCFVLSDNECVYGFKNTGTHAHTQFDTSDIFSLTCDVQTLQTTNNTYTKWQSNFRFPLGTAKCHIMNVLNAVHDNAGAVHMEGHPSKLLQTDPHDPFGLV